MRNGFLMMLEPWFEEPVLFGYTPEDTTLNVLLGDSLNFSVQVRDQQGDDIFYLWTMQEDTLSEDSTATAHFEELGQFEVHCSVTDCTNTVGITWHVDVREWVLESFFPDSLFLSVRRNNEVTFGSEVRTVEDYDLNYSWSHIDRNGRREYQGDNDSLTYRFETTGAQSIVCVIGNGGNNERIVWEIAVNSVVWWWWPHELEFRAPVDTTVDFSIFPFNEESDSLECLWTIDGEELDFGNDIDILFNETGMHEVVAYVTEGVEADTVRWRVEVYDAERTADFADMADLPSEPMLYAPAPNPFNARTSVRFYLPKQESVQIDLINSIGRVVRKLENRKHRSGFHSIAIEMTDLASGVYFIRMKTRLYQNTVKAVFIR